MPDLLRRTGDPREVTRKRFARRQWSRRWLAWRVVAVAVLAVAGVAGLLWTVFVSSLLAVDGVEVRGNQLLTAEQVQAAADAPDGTPLARVDIDAITARIEAMPAVESVDVSRQWPSAILIDITERQAVAAIEVDGKLRGIDEDGVVFRDFARAPANLPLIKVAPATRGEAMAEAAAVVGVLPADVARRVAYVDVKTVDELSLVMRGGKVVVWGSADESEQKARVLDALLVARKGARVYDVSVPGQPTTR